MVAYMTRGALAKQAGVHIETIRFYETKGLLPLAQRTASGYRMYDDSAIDRIKDIQQLLSVGFSLKEIAEIEAIPASVIEEKIAILTDLALRKA